MKATEAAALLTIAAAYDNRKPDADQAKAWVMVLDGLRFEDCRAAIVAHYQTSREWLMPSMVIAGVRHIRDRRETDFDQRFGPYTPPDMDLGAELEWIARVRREIRDGIITSPDQIETRGELVQRNMPDLQALMRRAE